MNNLIIAALTFIMLPALGTQASAKSEKNCIESVAQLKKENKETEVLSTAYSTQPESMIVEKKNFSNEIVNDRSNEDMTTVNVDYIIEDGGKAFVTYIDAASESAKFEVVKFIESSSYNFDIVPGKIYSMKLTLKK